MPTQISEKKCVEIFGKYLFADKRKSYGMEKFPSGIKYERERNSDTETEIFWTVMLDWYQDWKRTRQVTEAFEVLCGCKKSNNMKKFLDPGTRKMFRGTHILKNVNFMKELLNLKKKYKKEMYNTRWVGADYTYTPLYDIESWSALEDTAFLFSAPNGALNTQRAKFLQIQYMKEMEKALKLFNWRKLSKKKLSDIIVTRGLSTIFESKTDANCVMKPFLSNHMFYEVSGMRPEDEIVRLEKSSTKPGIVWIPEDVQEMYDKSDKMKGKSNQFVVFEKGDSLVKSAKWIRPREKDFKQEYEVEWSLQMKPVYGDLFPTYEDFKKHVSKKGKVITITLDADAGIEKRSRRKFFEDLIALLKNYKSWGTPYRNTKTVEALEERIRMGETMAMPIILNFRGPWKKKKVGGKWKWDGVEKGSHKVILGGNTRCDIAFWYNNSIKGFEITLDWKDFFKK